MSAHLIIDVPCGSCVEGYDRFHECASEMFCPCDRGHLHKTLAARIDELERECKVGPYSDRVLRAALDGPA